jgi:hypothetical protein
MRKIYLVFFLSIVISIQAIAQNKQYFDAPFGGGGGFIPGWYIPNLDPLNEELKALGAPELSTSGLFTTGGGGFIYLGIIQNVRFGGLGFGGSKSEEGKINLQGSIYDFETIYSISGGGLTVEYTLPFVKNVGVSIGALIGCGSVTIETFRNRGSFSWDGLWNEDPSTENVSRTLKNSYWILSPTLNVDIPFYRFLSFRLGAGYQFALGDDWKVENDKSLSGVPSDLNGSSFFIQSGIFIGFFSY